MASFQKIQELMLPCLAEEIIDDEEFLVLYEAYAPQNLPFQHSVYEKFSLENKNSAECKADFRVDKRDIALLLEALNTERSYKREGHAPLKRFVGFQTDQYNGG